MKICYQTTNVPPEWVEVDAKTIKIEYGDYKRISLEEILCEVMDAIDKKAELASPDDDKPAELQGRDEPSPSSGAAELL